MAKRIIIDAPELPRAERDYIKFLLIKYALYSMDDGEDPCFTIEGKMFAETKVIDQYLSAYKNGDISPDELGKVIMYTSFVSHILFNE